MKGLFFTLFPSVLFIGSATVNAQQKVVFEYDACGNRTRRFISSVHNPINVNNQRRKEITAASTFKFYPNPVSDQFTIEVPIAYAGQLGNKVAVLYDLNGKILKSVPLFEGLNFVDMVELSSAIYLVEVTYGDFFETIRVVKNK